MNFFLNFRARPSGSGIADPAPVVQEVSIDPNTGNPVIDAPVPLSSPVQQSITLAALKAAALGKNVLLVTHGFNVNQDNGFKELSNWQTFLQLPNSFLFVGMVWPGDSSWLGPFSYPGEGVPAKECGSLLASFIQQNLTGAASLSFVSHSLGAPFVLQAIRELAANRIPVRQVALMAGAINDDCLTNEYADAVSTIENIHVLASVKDAVLSWAFPIGNVAQEVVDDDTPYFDAALGHKGPRSQPPGRPTGAYQIPKGWDYGHHNYIEVQPALNPPLPLPQELPVPPNDHAPEPTNQPHWQPSWSAAFVSSRFK